jgi:hypothetical protein
MDYPLRPKKNIKNTIEDNFINEPLCFFFKYIFILTLCVFTVQSFIVSKQIGGTLINEIFSIAKNESRDLVGL